MKTDTHRIINYLSKIIKIATGFNMSLFCRFEKLDDNVFEIEHAKSRVIHNLPQQLGIFILQYAKMGLLEFCYDFIDYVIDFQ